MKSITTELLKYLTSEGIAVIGDPYWDHHPEEPELGLSFAGASTSWTPLGLFTLFRFSSGRWLVQWHMMGADRQPPPVRAAEVIALLDGMTRAGGVHFRSSSTR